MNHFTRLLITVLSLAVLCLATSCAKKKKGDQYAGVDGDYDYVSGTPLPDRVEGSNFLAGNVNRNQFEPVMFGYDSYTVSSSETYKLQNVSQYMSANSGDLIVAGFTDDRGTAEYNRNLGELRAQAVRQALISLGVSGSKIQTVSFGEEMPASEGSSASAYAANRRAEFGILK